MENDPKFDLEHQFKLYLERVNFGNRALPEVQYIEMKRAFFGACGQLLLLMRDDLSELSDEEGVQVLADLLNQVGDFWSKQS